MLELEEALDRILSAMPAPVSEKVELNAAHRRVIAERFTSPIDLPVFDNSAMDGYAVRAEDVASATADAPAKLLLSGRVAAGESFSGKLLSGACVRVFTGSLLPSGADAVVMQEDTRAASNSPGEVLILDGAKPWENVRLRGTDVKKGSLLLDKGELLTASRLNLLAATGVTNVLVGRQPVVGLLATGSELREGGQALASGQIYESNRIGLSVLAHEAGAVAKIYPLVADDPESVLIMLKQALAECDAVITSGGVSVGEMDFVKSAFEKAGGAMQFWRVSIKPGRPFVFGRYNERFLFGLPGNPVSALVTFLLLVRPALLRWQGATDVRMPSQTGVLAEPLPNPGQRRHFIRVKVESGGKVFSAGVQGSHALLSLAKANGLVDVPPATTLAAGASVAVMRWDF